MSKRRKTEVSRRKEQDHKYKLYNFESLNKKDTNSILKSILIESSPAMLSKLEKQVLSRICKNGIPWQYRRLLWLRASGAYSMMSMKQYKNYYMELKEQPEDLDNSSFNQVDLDIKRTFFDLKSSYSG